MKKILVLVIAATMDLSSAALAAETATVPAPTAMTTKVTPAKTMHHKKQHKATPAQKAQTTKKHHKDTKAGQKVPEQEAQVVERHAKKHSHRQPAKPAA